MQLGISLVVGGGGEGLAMAPDDRFSDAVAERRMNQPSEDRVRRLGGVLVGGATLGTMALDAAARQSYWRCTMGLAGGLVLYGTGAISL